jgi:hypothetical protein
MKKKILQVRLVLTGALPRVWGALAVIALLWAAYFGVISTPGAL